MNLIPIILKDYMLILALFLNTVLWCIRLLGFDGFHVIGKSGTLDQLPFVSNSPMKLAMRIDSQCV